MDQRTTTTYGDGGHADESRSLLAKRAQQMYFNEDYLQHMACCDPVELISRVGTWNWGLTLLERGGIRAEGAVVPLGSMLIARLNCNRALLHRLEAPQGRTSVVLFSGGAKVFVQGYLVAADDALILRSGSRVEFVSRAGGVALVISVSEAEWCRKVPLADCTGIELHGGVELLRSSVSSTLALVKAVDSVMDAFTTRPNTLPGQARREALVDVVFALLAGIQRQHRPRAAERRKGARRRMGVERARDYILNHLCDPIRLADLCRHTHLQARSLEYGFREIVGLSPVSYVKMLRLGEAHRRLLSRAWRCLSISEIALDSGFCHLSQFAADYKRLFMESPSTTRQRSIDQCAGGAKPFVEVRRTGALSLQVLDVADSALARETSAGLSRFASSRAVGPTSVVGT
jgi:AraC family transcriptional regulator, ethanolamine operon transcriptional activator